MAKEINIERVIEKSIYFVVEKLKRLDKYDMSVNGRYDTGAQVDAEIEKDGEWVKWSDIEKIIKEL